MSSSKYVHMLESRSWWSGAATAVCGYRVQSKNYERVGPLAGPDCPDCRRIVKRRKKASRR